MAESDNWDGMPQNNLLDILNIKDRLWMSLYESEVKYWIYLLDIFREKYIISGEKKETFSSQIRQSTYTHNQNLNNLYNPKF